MAGTFILGEEKIRPGSYFRIKKNGDDATSEIVNGVTAVIFRSDFGPLGKASVLGRDEGYESTYGTGGTTDAIKEAFKGGANTVVAVRLGDGGSLASVKLKNTEDEEAVTISTKQPGSKSFSVTVREKVTDTSVKECIIYTGASVFERYQFQAGEGEAAALAEAVSISSNFAAKVTEGKEKAVLADVSQEGFEGGEDPAVTINDYSAAFGLAEPYMFNTICVDTEDTAVHSLLYAFVNRIFENGSLVQAVIAEKSSVPLETR